MGLLAMFTSTRNLLSAEEERPKLNTGSLGLLQVKSRMKGIGQEAIQKTSFLKLTFQTNYFRGALHGKTLGSD